MRASITTPALAALVPGLIAAALAAPAGRWTAAAPMPEARTEVAVAALDGRIYVVGAWAPMPTARHGLGAAAVGGRIFVISGGPRPGGSCSSANEVFQPGEAGR